MAKVSYVRKDDAFYQLIKDIDTVEEAVRFFKDFCSQTELESIEQRFEVARLLLSGDKYATIVEKTGASSATISRVKRAIRAEGSIIEELLAKLK